MDGLRGVGSALAWLGVAGVLAINWVACTAGDDRGPPGAARAVEDYFVAFAESRWRIMAGVSTGAARQYADYQVAGERAVNPPAQDGFAFELDVGAATVDDDTVRFGGEAVFALAGGDTRFRGFTVVADGDGWLLADYVRDGRPLRDFVAGVDGVATVGAVEVRADVAFRDPSSGNLNVPVAITNAGADEIVLASYQATFTSTLSGRSHAIDFSGPGAVPASATVDVILVFDGVDDADEGGPLDVRLRADAAGEPLAFAFDLPAFGAE